MKPPAIQKLEPCVLHESGDAWKEGGIDATGSLIVIALKIISCVINYNDGVLKEEDLREAQLKALKKLPSLLEYFGYCLCCGSHFAGPVYEMKDYLEWSERKGVLVLYSCKCFNMILLLIQPLSSVIDLALAKLFFKPLSACMGLYLYLVPHFPLSRFTEPVYQEYDFWKRLSYQYMSGFTARWKYYFIWSISEASIIISGFGFSVPCSYPLYGIFKLAPGSGMVS
ncbi:lysophospholipid acyltransferase 2-like [Salvia splendens]|uniref:lysophospholipid acyltransferase 2-like n=1 Tax=Salvia splendens TaxID=180675 RepID=UPI001C2779A0|nr:lysophospholipid acyltransferase 2-like [Salvia splendens]